MSEVVYEGKAEQLVVSYDYSLWEKLRRPFDLDQIELLPKYTGKKQNGKIPMEAYKRCGECGGYHPFPCVHLNYVGHAQITDRLNEVDPMWNWEPCGFDQFGQPLIKDGGMWIRLTVLGVTHYGYGDAQGKTGHDATKEIIGDAIRNAAMRFGVGSYLWSKSERAKQTLVEGSQEPEVHEKAPDEREAAKQRLWAAIKAYCERKGINPNKELDEIGGTEALKTKDAKWLNLKADYYEAN